MPNNDSQKVHASPVAEGVRIQVGNATAFAVRQESKDVALRLRREYHPVRDAMERIACHVQTIHRADGLYRRCSLKHDSRMVLSRDIHSRECFCIVLPHAEHLSVCNISLSV